MIYSEYACWVLFRQVLPPELCNRVYFWGLKEYRKDVKMKMKRVLEKAYPRIMVEDPDLSYWWEEMFSLEKFVIDIEYEFLVYLGRAIRIFRFRIHELDGRYLGFGKTYEFSY